MICKAWTVGEAHIQSLIAQYGLNTIPVEPFDDRFITVRGVKVCKTGFSSIPETNSVIVKEIESEEEYWAALHEIGHCVDERARTLFIEQRNTPLVTMFGLAGFTHDAILDVEAAAWRWAIQNSMYELNARVIQRIAMCLRQYTDCWFMYNTVLPHKIESDLLWTMLNY